MTKENQYKVVEISADKNIERSSFHLVLQIIIFHLRFAGRLPSFRSVVDKICLL